MAATVVAQGAFSGIGAGNSAVTPAYGATPTAGNMLYCWCAGFNKNTLPATPSGWTVISQVQAGTSVSGGGCSSSIYARVAVGADAAPTFAAGGASTQWGAMLIEVSGLAAAAAADQVGSAVTTTTSPLIADNAAADAAVGEFFMWCWSERITAVAAGESVTLNNGMTVNETNNTATSTANHYSLGYGITTDNSVPDEASVAFTTTGLAAASLAIASFSLAGAAVDTGAPLTRPTYLPLMAPQGGLG